MSTMIDLWQYCRLCNPEIYLTRLFQKLPECEFDFREVTDAGIVYNGSLEPSMVVIDTESYTIEVSGQNDKAELEANMRVTLLLRGINYAIAAAVDRLCSESNSFTGALDDALRLRWDRNDYGDCVTYKLTGKPDVRVGIHALNCSPNDFISNLRDCNIEICTSGLDAMIYVGLDNEDLQQRVIQLYLDVNRGYVSYLMSDWFSAYAPLRAVVQMAITCCCDYDIEKTK